MLTLPFTIVVVQYPAGYDKRVGRNSCERIKDYFMRLDAINYSVQTLTVAAFSMVVTDCGITINP